MENKVLIKNNNISLVYINESMTHDIWQNSLDENNRRFVPDEVFETIEEAESIVRFIMSCYQNEECPQIFAVIRNSDNANLGYVQLVEIEEGYEIGYHIAKKYTNNGYATEALLLFLDYLKNSTNIKEVYGIALSENVASKKVLKKCGFQTISEGMGLYQGSKREIIRTIKVL